MLLQTYAVLPLLIFVSDAHCASKRCIRIRRGLKSWQWKWVVGWQELLWRKKLRRMELLGLGVIKIMHVVEKKIQLTLFFVFLVLCQWGDSKRKWKKKKEKEPIDILYPSPWTVSKVCRKHVARLKLTVYFIQSAHSKNCRTTKHHLRLGRL